MAIGLPLLFLVTPVQAWLSWSPEGNRFTHDIDGEISVVNPYTGETRAIHSGSSPQWHPSRELILFTYANGAYTINPDGTGKQKVGDAESAGWSPDGNRYAYWDHRETGKITVPVIWIGELDGEDKVIEIFLGNRAYTVLGWGEYGISYITVAGWAIRSFHDQSVVIIDPDTGEHVYPERMECPGRRTTTTIRSSNSDRIACIYVEQRIDVDLDPPPDWVPERRFYLFEEGGEETDIGEDLDIRGASWSPDGKILAFDALVETDIRNLFYVDVDNPEEIKQLTPDRGWNSYPEWSPAGDLIVYRNVVDLYNWETEIGILKWKTSTNIQPISWGELKSQHRSSDPK